MTVKGEEFSNAVGATVSAVLIEMYFYMDEQEASIGNLIVDLTDGRRYLFACRGDGGIYVTHIRSDVSLAPPNFVVELWPIPSIEGGLESVEWTMTGVQIVIGDKKLCIVNADDELEITSNGKSVREIVTAR
jgi:precorrin-2 methylase